MRNLFVSQDGSLLVEDRHIEGHAFKRTRLARRPPDRDDVMASTVPFVEDVFYRKGQVGPYLVWEESR